VLELVGPAKRSMYSLLVEYSWYASRLLMVLVFYYWPYFRHVQTGVTTFEVLSLCFVGYIPESIRWQLSKGRYEAARQSITEAVEVNSARKPALRVNMHKKVDRLVEFYTIQRLAEADQRKSAGRSMLRLLRVTGMLKVTLSIYFCWFCGGLLSYSMTYNSAQLGSNLYVNFALLTLSSIVCTTCLYFCIERWDRKRFVAIAYTTMFVSCVTLSYVFAYHPLSEVRILLSMIFSFCASACYHIIMLLSSETFPTEIRQFAVGWCSVATRFGSIVAPFTRELVSRTCPCASSLNGVGRDLGVSILSPSLVSLS
jgi:hypothetical protein